MAERGNAVISLGLRGVLRRIETETDGELLEHFVTRQDGEAFARLVRRHGPMVFAVCRRVLGGHADAEDAFQATFLVLARRAGVVRPGSSLANWLHGVALRTAQEARRAAAIRRAKERTAAGMRSQQSAPIEPTYDLSAVLDRELAALPEVYRAAVVVCDLEGLSRAQAATHLGWSEGTLSGRLARARAILARRLGKYSLTVSGGLLGPTLAGPAEAAVPPWLVEPTVRMSLLMAAGEAATVAPAPILALTEGVMKGILMTKLKVSAAALLVGCAVLLTTAAGWQANWAGAADPAKPGDPPRKAVRDPDKERIAQLERECELLRREVAVLRERLALAEARQKAADGVDHALAEAQELRRRNNELEVRQQIKQQEVARALAIQDLAKYQEELRKSPNSAEAKLRLEKAQVEVERLSKELKKLFAQAWYTEAIRLADEAMAKKAAEDAAQRQAIKELILNAQLRLRSHPSTTDPTTLPQHGATPPQQPTTPAAPGETVGEKLLASLQLLQSRQDDLKKSPGSAEAKHRLEDAEREVQRIRQLADPATRKAADDLRSALDALKGPLGTRDANAQVRQAQLKVTREYLAARDRLLKLSSSTDPTAPTSPITPSKPADPVTVNPIDQVAANEAKLASLFEKMKAKEEYEKALEREVQTARQEAEALRRVVAGMPGAFTEKLELLDKMVKAREKTLESFQRGAPAARQADSQEAEELLRVILAGRAPAELKADPSPKPGSLMPVVPRATNKPADPRIDPFGPPAGGLAKPVVRIYRLDGLVANEKEAEAMIKVVRATVAPKSWGVEAEVEYFAPANGIVVRQTPEVHKEIEDLLQMLRSKSGQAK